MENLSMSGETEIEDFQDFKIELENQKDLDSDIQDIINEIDETKSNTVSTKKNADKDKDNAKNDIKHPPKCVHY